MGSTKAVVGSGSKSMSLSLIFWKPRMLDPSKPMPSVKQADGHVFHGDGEVLPEARQVDELQIDDLDALLLGHRDYFLRLGFDVRTGLRQHIALLVMTVNL